MNNKINEQKQKNRSSENRQQIMSPYYTLFYTVALIAK